MEVEGYENYMIYKDGRVWSKPKPSGGNKFLKPNPDGCGYLHVRLHKDGKRKMMKIHRLIALHYIPNPENKPEIDHIDNNRQNNDISNLRWVSHGENQINKCAYGAVPFKGVCKKGNRFQASKRVDGKSKHIGYYKTAEEASEAWIKYCTNNNIML